MKVAIDSDKCMGHGMCYALAPDVYTDDEHGYGHVIGDGTVRDDQAEAARHAAANCPESAVAVDV
ncbi:ferredoxin [Mycolicibacterium monacense]|uniref:Ferredoxin n=2 Tax=Mycobacteriaceae TaxID=1762 RepID=A0AAD1IRP7_MYCMB|nr:ferredoxin [Mycolicibacterium monacense]MDA4104663.1 ferredoxin [Mycolicibacterium monacense DSM 44395]ORB22703.1 ferredoxin [Mycolicibacterium monacense DSM 44395]QHP87585.1 ferredoxin [Mycolicibacterium monacense DSM 44395]BBZ59268.1 ferredoxin [Mycolicibacterium monacense]